MTPNEKLAMDIFLLVQEARRNAAAPGSYLSKTTRKQDIENWAMVSPFWTSIDDVVKAAGLSAVNPNGHL